jgi:hypothetical protein
VWHCAGSRLKLVWTGVFAEKTGILKRFPVQVAKTDLPFPWCTF